MEPKCWKNHPFRSLHSEALKCLRRVCGSPSRPIADHPYFSITLCTSHEHHNICGTYFTALLAVASRAPESGSEGLKLSLRRKSHEKKRCKMGKGATCSVCTLGGGAKTVSLAQFSPNSGSFNVTIFHKFSLQFVVFSKLNWFITKKE